MINLIKNELIKIFKRKNIYILLMIGVLVIFMYNIVAKIGNQNVDIQEQYKKAYKNDTLLLENFDTLTKKEPYSNIIERLALESYAIDNNIEYNILINSQNNNVPLPADARYMLMRVFNNFDIVMIFIIIYLSSTIICEEFNSGTIKNLLLKPYTRSTILLVKIYTSVFLIFVIMIFVLLFQTCLGGLIFGYDSYSLDAIRYNHTTANIERMDLFQYILVIACSKMPMYLLLMLTSLLFGIITSNMALNILVSLGLYFVSTFEILLNKVTQYIYIFNWDISKYLFDNTCIKPILISIISMFIILILLNQFFKNKEIINE